MCRMTVISNPLKLSKNNGRWQGRLRLSAPRKSCFLQQLMSKMFHICGQSPWLTRQQHYVWDVDTYWICISFFCKAKCRYIMKQGTCVEMLIFVSSWFTEARSVPDWMFQKGLIFSLRLFRIHFGNKHIPPLLFPTIQERGASVVISIIYLWETVLLNYLLCCWRPGLALFPLKG